MNRFYEQVAGVLETDEVGYETRFRDTPLWCSLQAFGLLVLMENDFNAPLDLERLRKINTVGELYEIAFVAFAAQVFKCEVSSLQPESAMGAVAGWDSVTHLKLFMEAEKFFGSRYELATMPEIHTLRDFVRKEAR